MHTEVVIIPGLKMMALAMGWILSEPNQQTYLQAGRSAAAMMNQAERCCITHNIALMQIGAKFERGQSADAVMKSAPRDDVQRLVCQQAKAHACQVSYASRTSERD